MVSGDPSAQRGNELRGNSRSAGGVAGHHGARRAAQAESIIVRQHWQQDVSKDVTADHRDGETPDVQYDGPLHMPD